MLSDDQDDQDYQSGSDNNPLDNPLDNPKTTQLKSSSYDSPKHSNQLTANEQQLK